MGEPKSENQQAFAIHNVSNWVAVIDKLPPNKNKKYLVIRDGEIEICKWMYRSGGKGYWWNYLGITHWMELPEPPCC
jgi:hypothetical protein